MGGGGGGGGGGGYSSPWIRYCGGKQTTSESPCFSNGSSRKSFTSFDTYFVLLEQLASLSDKCSTLKNYPVFLFKEIEPFKYYLLIRALSMLSLLFAQSFKFSQTSKKVVISSLCCFLFLNYDKKDCHDQRV